MEKIRFSHFVSLIGGIHKSLQKIKLENAAEVGLKGVHMFWLYELSHAPDGMTASELALRNAIDRSLISREIDTLRKDGYIRYDTPDGRHNYNSKIKLTHRGRELAEQIGRAGLLIQEQVNRGVSEEDLETFYNTLETLYRNFSSLNEQEFNSLLSINGEGDENANINPIGGI